MNNKKKKDLTRLISRHKFIEQLLLYMYGENIPIKRSLREIAEKALEKLYED